MPARRPCAVPAPARAVPTACCVYGCVLLQDLLTRHKAIVAVYLQEHYVEVGREQRLAVKQYRTAGPALRSGTEHRNSAAVAVCLAFACERNDPAALSTMGWVGGGAGALHARRRTQRAAAAALCQLPDGPCGTYSFAPAYPRAWVSRGACACAAADCCCCPAGRRVPACLPACSSSSTTRSCCSRPTT